MPLNERCIRYNQVAVIKKILQKVITNCSWLSNRYRQEKTEATRHAYRKLILCEAIGKEQTGILQKPHCPISQKMNYLESHETFGYG